MCTCVRVCGMCLYECDVYESYVGVCVSAVCTCVCDVYDVCLCV